MEIIILLKNILEMDCKEDGRMVRDTLYKIYLKGLEMNLEERLLEKIKGLIWDLALQTKVSRIDMEVRAVLTVLKEKYNLED